MKQHMKICLHPRNVSKDTMCSCCRHVRKSFFVLIAKTSVTSKKMTSAANSKKNSKKNEKSEQGSEKKKGNNIVTCSYLQCTNHPIDQLTLSGEG